LELSHDNNKITINRKSIVCLIKSTINNENEFCFFAIWPEIVTNAINFISLS